MKCELCIVHFAVFSIQCRVCSVQGVLYSVQCAMLSLHLAVLSVQCSPSLQLCFRSCEAVRDYQRTVCTNHMGGANITVVRYIIRANISVPGLIKANISVRQIAKTNISIIQISSAIPFGKIVRIHNLRVIHDTFALELLMLPMLIKHCLRKSQYKVQADFREGGGGD